MLVVPRFLKISIDQRLLMQMYNQIYFSFEMRSTFTFTFYTYERVTSVINHHVIWVTQINGSIEGFIFKLFRFASVPPVGNFSELYALVLCGPCLFKSFFRTFQMCIIAFKTVEHQNAASSLWRIWQAARNWTKSEEQQLKSLRWAESTGKWKRAGLFWLCFNFQRHESFKNNNLSSVLLNKKVLKHKVHLNNVYSI